MPSIKNIPQDIIEAIQGGAHIVLSISGGKDSDAMSRAMLRFLEENKLTNPVAFVHADLGEMEWTSTPEYLDWLMSDLGYPLNIVRHKKYDLITGIEARHAQRPDVVPFPDAKNRYCTSDWKRNPISTWVRNTYVQDATVIMCMGLRAEESPARKKRGTHKLRQDCLAPTKNRVVWDWNPIFDWTTDDVWHELIPLGDDRNGLEVYRLHYRSWKGKHTEGTSGEFFSYMLGKGLMQRYRAHPAYAIGNDRLSCGTCVLGCASDIINGANDNPKTFRRLVDLEIGSGFSFQQGKPLWEKAPHLLTDAQKKKLNIVA